MKSSSKSTSETSSQDTKKHSEVPETQPSNVSVPQNHILSWNETRRKRAQRRKRNHKRRLKGGLREPWREPPTASCVSVSVPPTPTSRFLIVKETTIRKTVVFILCARLVMLLLFLSSTNSWLNVRAVTTTRPTTPLHYGPTLLLI